LPQTPAPNDSEAQSLRPNLRDLGGHVTGNGAVLRGGLVYRSGQLSPMSPGEMEQIALLGLKNVFDLRTNEEVSARPDEIPPGVNYQALDVLAENALAPAQFVDLLLQPERANAELGDGKVEALLTQVYRKFVHLPSAKQAYGEMFASLGRPDQLPALVHCAAGKDRTGWAAAALLTLLGVPREAVMADFLRSNDHVIPLYHEEIDAFVAAGGQRSILLALVGVKPEYLDASFDEVEQRHGTIEGYFADALGIDAARQETMRELYVGE
jgi:protein-tyrosine phosphatase